MKWKPISEKPPSDMYEALVIVPGCTKTVCSYIDFLADKKVGFYILGNGCATHLEGVTWYLPLPKPPEGL